MSTSIGVISSYSYSYLVFTKSHDPSSKALAGRPFTGLGFKVRFRVLKSLQSIANIPEPTS